MNKKDFCLRYAEDIELMDSMIHHYEVVMVLAEMQDKKDKKVVFNYPDLKDEVLTVLNKEFKGNIYDVKIKEQLYLFRGKAYELAIEGYLKEGFHGNLDFTYNAAFMLWDREIGNGEAVAIACIPEFECEHRFETSIHMALCHFWSVAPEDMDSLEFDMDKANKFYEKCSNEDCDEDHLVRIELPVKLDDVDFTVYMYRHGIYNAPHYIEEA